MAARIASLLASGTEIVCGLGLDDQLVAISHECDYPAHVMDRPRVTRALVNDAADSATIDAAVRDMAATGQALYDIDVGTLSAARPDLIITQSQCAVCAVSYADVCNAVAGTPALQHARIVDLNPQTLSDVLADIHQVAEACEAVPRGQRWLGELQTRVERVRNSTVQLTPQQRCTVLCLEWLNPPMVAGNWIPELLELAGARGILASPGQKSPTICWSDIAASDPDVVVLMPCGFDLDRTVREAAVLRDQGAWRALHAVQAGRVFAVDGNAYFNRSGPRIVDSLEILAHLLHPQRCAALPYTADSWTAFETSA